MHKNTVVCNSDIEIQSVIFTVEGYVSVLDVATPDNDSISVNIVHAGGDTVLFEARLAYKLTESPGYQLLTVLEMAFIYKKLVRLTGYTSGVYEYIETVKISK
ncbi:hypothetical protein [Xenorhabdus lircayensis]|uniref:Uncharacterized protein n=1 Tax=Xenorhabdus lircayensis TaxID=2763499 RepID=A0ABS0U7J6_9GAMM|nr:hypothetical protein [Xenorhabdus lircayensis]MBI6549854.1 hypothetical protein [Xenorhabdus lircayensis]